MKVDHGSVRRFLSNLFSKMDLWICGEAGKDNSFRFFRFETCACLNLAQSIFGFDQGLEISSLHPVSRDVGHDCENRCGRRRWFWHDSYPHLQLTDSGAELYVCSACCSGAYAELGSEFLERSPGNVVGPNGDLQVHPPLTSGGQSSPLQAVPTSKLITRLCP